MNQSFSAQVLTRKTHHKSKQASGAKNYIAKCNRVATYRANAASGG